MPKPAATVDVDPIITTIRETRKARGLRVRDVAATADMAEAQLSRLELGHNPPHLATVRSVLDALELDLAVVPK